MLSLLPPLLDDLAEARIDLSPGRYGLLNACDGGLLEVSGLSAPVGALCKVAHGPRTNGAEPLTAEVIGFRNGRTLMMLLGDTVMLRPGARVGPKAGRECCRWARPSWAARSTAKACRSTEAARSTPRSEWPAGGVRTGALDRSPVREPFDTGVRALNALTTFGVGQRIGIMAGSGVGKSVLLDMIAHTGRSRDRRRRPDRRARARGVRLSSSGT
jgi:flagellum-specific ATP synthase